MYHKSKVQHFKNVLNSYTDIKMRYGKSRCHVNYMRLLSGSKNVMEKFVL